MLKRYGEVVVSDNLMEFISDNIKDMFKYNDKQIRITKELMLSTTEWSVKIYYDIQSLIDKIKDKFKIDRYLIVDGGSKLFIIFPEKYEIRFTRVLIDDDFRIHIKENILCDNTKESYYTNLTFMHTKSIDNMLYDFCLA